MFTQSADLYDLIYFSFKDYPAETRSLVDLIRRLHPTAKTVLDVACGTGEHARLLSEQFNYSVDAVDLDPRFVEIARGKLPAALIERADMVDFDLGRRYDAVLCLFSSIGYVRTLANLRSALASFRRHVAAGGIVIVEPWLTPDVIENGRVDAETAKTDKMAVCRAGRVEVEDRLSRIHFEYLMARPDGFERASEVHELGLFTVPQMLDSFREAGLDAVREEHGLCGRGMYIAR